MVTHIERQVQAQDVAPGQQRRKVDVLGAVLLRRAQPAAVVVAHRHAERARLGRHVAPDAAHAQDAEDLALRVVPERGEVGEVAARAAGAAKGAPAERRHAGVEVAQGAEDEEQRDVGGGVVDGRRDVGDADVVRAARGNVDLVIPGACFLCISNLRIDLRSRKDKKQTEREYV